MQFTVPNDQLNRILDSDHHDPFEVLGAHVVEVDGAPVVSIRAHLPFAERVWVMP
jgi:1,4-alpha-glucan branching enzyme